MAKLGEAFVVIRARLKPLKDGLEAARKAVKNTMHAISSVVKTGYEIAKKAALGFLAVTTAATYAAIKEEAAIIELASALKMAGNYSDDLLSKMKKQASAIQDVTVYGDEYILTLMRMAMTQGVAAESASEAARAAIALYEGFGRGIRGTPGTFLRHFIDAIRGSGETLANFVGEIKGAKTEQEKFDILQKAIARGWDVAKSKAESAGGALQQIKNIISDIGEVYGQYMLPAFQSMRDWFKKNKLEMMEWAERAGNAVIYVKNVLWELAKYTYSDFPKAMQAAWDVIRIGFKALADTIKVIWWGMLEEIKYLTLITFRDITKRAVIMWADVKSIPKEKGIFGIGAIGGARFRAREEAAAKFETQFPKIPKPKSILPDLGRIWKQAGIDIWKILPQELQKPLKEAYDKWLEQDAAIKEKYEKLRLEKAEEGKMPVFGMEDTTKKGIGFAGLVEAWKGFVSSLQPNIEKLQLNVQQKHLEIAKRSEQKLEIIAKAMPSTGTVG